MFKEEGLIKVSSKLNMLASLALCINITSLHFKSIVMLSISNSTVHELHSVWVIWDSLYGTLDKNKHGRWDNLYWVLKILVSIRGTV